MHVVFRESHGVEETETPTDLGQAPADLVVLSFSDSDLGAFSEGWHRGGGAAQMPSLRLANLAALKHPLSVDTYIAQTLVGAKGVLVRLIGGVPYWQYGLQQLRELARARGIAVAVLPADGRVDTRLDDYSTLPVSTLRRLAHFCDNGGAVAAQAALAQLALAAGLYAGPVQGSKVIPQVGAWSPQDGVRCTALAHFNDPKPRIVIVFYRSYLVAADLAPIKALFDSFTARGYEVIGLFAPSLKAGGAAGWLRGQIVALAPKAIISATAFSGKGASGTSPLDAGGVPVFQVTLATSTHRAWQEAERGLSPTDLAMHVVLPEVDGRLTGGVVSFKEPTERDAALQFSRYIHTPDPDCINAVANRVEGWTNLARKAAMDRRVALILSTYPGKDWNMGHAVGLDAPASAEAILQDLAGEGYTIGTDETPLTEALRARSFRYPLADYAKMLETLPRSLRDDLHSAWGAAEDDEDVTGDAFSFALTRRGNVTIALQPERGTPKQRADEYHDLSRTPRHAYVAFYLWLQHNSDAVVHIGAHGTLEWLPGKSVALSKACWPEALIGPLPLVYPFIVNDPGEAAQAKRRVGALTLGHIPPPLRESGSHARLARLEALLDEFSNADGLAPKRRDRLRDDIRAEAQALGVEEDLGLDRATSSTEAITRIDSFVCDIKESQFGEGLHIWGRAPAAPSSFETEPSAGCERRALLDALNGRRIDAGPSGSPYRGRSDVLPTGRNMFTTDPRAVPTRAAYAQGVALGEELMRRHLQDEGDWPKSLIVDLWGSATMRTAGEEFAMALHLLGVRPLWEPSSERVSGIEVLPITELNRPRIDVTLRVSGLFRDVFPTLSSLFGQAIRALAQRDEAADWNPFAGREDLARVYGPAPGSFGLGMGASVEDYSDEGRRATGEAWLQASAWTFDGPATAQDPDGIRKRVAAAECFVHLQDLPETDLLLAVDYATHEAGFAAAQAVTGGASKLYHLDATRPDAPRARALSEEIARVMHARAANPEWIKGMQAHGFRGAAEIAATLDHMAAFAHLAGVVAPHLFDLYHQETLGNAEVEAFLQENNPDALTAMRDRFRALLDAGLWNSRRNSVRASLEVS